MIIHIIKIRKEEFFSNKIIKMLKIISEMLLSRNILLAYYLLQNLR